VNLTKNPHRGGVARGTSWTQIAAEWLDAYYLGTYILYSLKEAQLLVEMVESAAGANKKRPTWRAMAKKLGDLECWT
jgi:hypothetical protein